MENKELLNKLLNGEMQLHKLEDEVKFDQAAKIRRKFIETISNTKLDSIGSIAIDYEKIYKKNAENVIGAISIPLGVAGPVLINGEYAKGRFYVPLATSEGALIASISRGMKAITLSNGATVRIINEGMARAPVFELESVSKAIEFTNDSFLSEHILPLTASSFASEKLSSIYSHAASEATVHIFMPIASPVSNKNLSHTLFPTINGVMVFNFPCFVVLSAA